MSTALHFEIFEAHDSSIACTTEVQIEMRAILEVLMSVLSGMLDGASE